MKKIFILNFLLLCSMGLYAQALLESIISPELYDISKSKGLKISRIDILKENHILNITFEYYPKTGQRKKVVLYSHFGVSDTGFERVLKQEFFYDKKGNEILHYHYEVNPFNNNWVQTEKQEFFYDRNGNKTAEEYYYILSRQNKTWKKIKGTEIKYNSQNLPVLEKKYVLKSDTDKQLENTETIQREYNDNNQLKVEYKLDAYCNRKIEWEYSTAANQKTIKTQISYVQEILEGVTDWQPQEKIETTYDVNNNIISRIGFDYIDRQWQMNYKNEFSYTPGGKMQQADSCAIYYANNNGISEMNEKTEYKYDEKGSLISQKKYTGENSEPLSLSSQTYYTSVSYNKTIIYTKKILPDKIETINKIVLVPNFQDNSFTQFNYESGPDNSFQWKKTETHYYFEEKTQRKNDKVDN